MLRLQPVSAALRQSARSFSVVHDYSLNEKSRSVVSFFNQSAIDSAAIKVTIDPNFYQFYALPPAFPFERSLPPSLSEGEVA